MTEEQQLLSRQDAARLLGVSAQTISNWVERGILSGHTVDRFTYIDRNSLNHFFDGLQELERNEKELEKAQKEVKEQTKLINEQLSELRSLLIPKEINKVAFVDTVAAYIHSLVGDLLNDREAFILDSFLRGHTIFEVSDELGVTKSRCCQILQKACRKFRESSKDNVPLREQVRILNIKNDMKDIEIATLQRKLLTVIPVTDDNFGKKKFELLDTDITKLGFTVRLTNCLKHDGCDKLWQALSRSKAYLLKCRNFGRRSIGELEDFAENNGLTLGTDYSEPMKAYYNSLIKMV